MLLSTEAGSIRQIDMQAQAFSWYCIAFHCCLVYKSLLCFSQDASFIRFKLPTTLILLLIPVALVVALIG